jgi:hypothetical protein
MDEAQEFVQRNLGGLSGRPVWTFSVGTFGNHKRLIGRLMTREPRGIRGISGTSSRATTVSLPVSSTDTSGRLGHASSTARWVVASETTATGRI